MKIAIAVSAGLFVAFMSSQTDASEAMTGADLQEICTGSTVENKAACRFYILGIAQGIEAGMAIADGKTKGGRPCVPDNVPGSALELAVKMHLGKDLMAFPEDRKLDASGLVAAAIITTFPCQKRR